jgi:hypothetical protein
MAVDLQVQLQEAEQAYHHLMTGQSVAEFRDQNGELIRYTPANAGRLLAYILSLKSQLGLVAPGSMAPGRAFF